MVTKNAPTTFYYGANERYGIEYEFAEAFADYLGVQLQLTTVDQTEQVLPKISAGDAHIAAAGLSIAASPAADITFGPSYQRVSAQLVHRRGTQSPRSLDQLAGKTLEVQAGSTHVEILDQNREQYPALSWSEYRSTSAEPLLRRVADGTIDYAIVDSNEFELLRHYYPEVRVAFDLGVQNQLAWAVPASARELREEIDAFFASMQASGQLEEILDRYYVARRDFDLVSSRAFVRHLRDRLPKLRTAFEDAERATGIDWRLLAAIAYQESHWNPNAVSPTGVKGVMMLTVNTAGSVGVEDRADMRESILGGARYLASVIEMFPDRIPEEDRMLMGVAAYNIGFGHVEDARIITESKRADKDSWEDVRRYLPLLADESWYPYLKRGYAQGAIPVQYVDAVQHYYWLLDRLTATERFATLAESPEDLRDPI